MTAQLPLGVQLTDAASFDSYYLCRDHAEAVAALQQTVRGGRAAFPIYLWGRPGAGKSHLLQATCRAVAERGRSVAYLPLGAVGDASPALVEGYARSALVCLDNLDAVAGHRGWEEALFCLYQEMHENGGALVCAASQAPTQLDWALADFQSRLSWGLTFRMRPLTDEEKLAALRWRAQRRGLEMPLDVARWLLSRHARDMTSLAAALDRLDYASLAAQRRLTIPFVRSVLEAGGG